MNKLLYFFGGIIFTTITSVTLNNTENPDPCEEIKTTKKILLSLAEDFEKKGEENKRSVVLETLNLLKNKLDCNHSYDLEIARVYVDLKPVYVQGLNIPPKLGGGNHHEVIDVLFTRLNNRKFDIKELHDLLNYDRLLEGQDIKQEDFKTELFQNQYLQYRISTPSNLVPSSKELIDFRTLIQENAKNLEEKSLLNKNLESIDESKYEFDKLKTYKYKFPEFKEKTL